METVLMSEMFSVGAWKREADGCSYWWAWLAVGAVECRVAELAGRGWVRLAARRQSLCRGCELSPGAAVTLCPVVSPWAQPHHMAALASVPASSGASLEIWARLHCLVNSGVFSAPGNYELSFWYLCCLDLYFLGGFSTHGTFIRPDDQEWRDSIGVDWSASVNEINSWVF